MGRSGGGGPDGVAVVDKEAGWTSHDVVAKARGLLGTRKVGHAGTLDPDATGVLVVGVGRATRLLRFLQLLPKTYEATIVLGAETTTLDAAGEVTATYDMGTVSLDEVRAAATALTGDILQVPPMVSALKVGGRRLHELAREGIEVERAARPVHVERFEVTSTPDRAVFAATVECSSGTYVRSLAADLGRLLGGGAHLGRLRRSSVGAFTLADARPLAQIELLDLREAMRGFNSIVVDPATAARVKGGVVLDGVEFEAAGASPWAVYDTSGSLLAVYEPHPDGVRAKPSVVVAPGTDSPASPAGGVG